MGRYANRKLKTAASVTLAVLFSLLLLASAVFLFCRVGAVEVVGNESLSAEEILAASGLEKGRFLYGIDVDATEKMILSVFPEILSCEVDVGVIRTVTITVKECRPVYSAVIGSETAFFTPKLHVTGFGNASDCVPVTLPKVSRVIAGKTIVFADGELAYVPEILEALAAWQYADRITAVDVMSDRAVTFTVDGKYLFVLGNHEELDVKLRVSASMLENPTLCENETATVDVRKPKEVILRPIG